MEPINAEAASPDEVWVRVFDIVRREVDVATVWLAMQSVKPLMIDGNFFVAALPPEMQFLGINLRNSEASLAIEEALLQVTGRVLAFRLIEGQTPADWLREKLTSGSVVPPPKAVAEAPAPRPSAPPTETGPRPPRPEREVYPTWEKLNERLVQGYKTAPLMKYPQGQARYILTCIAMISDTMDLLLPRADQPRDEAQERTLAKTLERLGSVVTLDPLFLGIELMRYRQNEGKDVFV